jgi:hypothetical protein
MHRPLTASATGYLEWRQQQARTVTTEPVGDLCKNSGRQKFSDFSNEMLLADKVAGSQLLTKIIIFKVGNTRRTLA